MAATRSEGGLLPADVLARIAALDRDLGGLAASDFHLAPNERLGEAIARSWARLTAAWDAFSTDRDGLPVGDHAGRLTRERWLLPLFSELGYGRLIQQAGVELDGKTYAVFCEYNHSPVHLVGAGVPLDRRTAGVRGAADQSPHSVVQELLNRSNERLWGIVTNGLSLRLLRDNVTLTRQAYVEFDLEAIFATEAYEDFALLWLCAHQSRLEAETPEECWLELWTQAAQRDGTRALGELRSGVKRAIEALGRGFLAQPTNGTLHAALRDGGLDGPAYYRELLRLIYRLLFLFVAEDRDALLLPDDGSPERFDARERYESFYATKRLRRLSVRRRGGRAHDLYEQVKLLSGWLYDAGQPVLALPPLGSALWSPDTTPHLSDARLGNEALLEAIRELAYVEGGRRSVDFRNLGAEELGSVYESLLELHPEIDRETARFALTTVAGHERKQTGSYYTPTSLIGSLLETALDPVIDEAVKNDDPERAVLDLAVCDPACGSGHFLIAAANRIAKRLAGVREHDPEPAPEAIRHALRDVVSRCIHGVDVNPMAVELCKVSLWLEALEPGRPLSFLDHRIVLGNSLLGTTPGLIAAGIPSDAFKPILGDDKKTVTELKKRNAKELSGQLALDLAASTAEADIHTIAASASEIAAVDDDALAGVREQQRRFEQLLGSPELRRATLAADVWCAAFVAEKRPGAESITQDTLVRALSGGSSSLSDAELRVVAQARAAYAFLHWHLAFPSVWERGGFDVVMGNPPWERVKASDPEFFAAIDRRIAAAPAARRRQLVAQLLAESPAVKSEYDRVLRRGEGQSSLLRNSGRFPLCGVGRDINTFAVFAELMRSVMNPAGRLGALVPTGIATDDTTKLFFADCVERRALVSLFDFENRKNLFPDIDSRMKFCLLTLVGSERSVVSAEFAFFLQETADLADSERRFSLSAADIALINPNTRTAPIFRSGYDADLALRIYRKMPVLRSSDERSKWQTRTRPGLFHMGNDAALFVDGRDNAASRLYEAKFAHQFDHRWATVDGDTVREVTDAEKGDPSYMITTRYRVPRAVVSERLRREPAKWLLGFRDITNATNERTALFFALPCEGVGHNTTLLFIDETPPRLVACLLATMNSLVLDFLLRQKMNGTHLSAFVLWQLPVPSPDDLAAKRYPWNAGPLEAWLLPRVLELTYTSWDMIGFADSLDYEGPPFSWGAPRRDFIRAEVDAAFFHVYGLVRDDVERVIDTFPIVRDHDVKAHGEYRTKRVILEIYDEMARAAASGREYATPLNPPPGDPRVAHADATVGG